MCSTWQGVGNRIASRLGLAPVIRIVELPHVDVPLVVGCLRPIVVLPIAAMAQLNAAQVEAILAHEIAHVRRHDYLVNLMQTLAETLLFYHPAVWWLSARIRDEREHCCDDVAVAVCGDPVGYAAALAELEAWRSGELTLLPRRQAVHCSIACAESCGLKCPTSRVRHRGRSAFSSLAVASGLALNVARADDRRRPSRIRSSKSRRSG